MHVTTDASRELPQRRTGALSALSDEPGLGRRVAVGVMRALGAASATLSLWRDRTEERRRLAEFPDYLLKDLGLTRVQAETEARKPFWRA